MTGPYPIDIESSKYDPDTPTGVDINPVCSCSKNPTHRMKAIDGYGLCYSDHAKSTWVQAIDLASGGRL